MGSALHYIHSQGVLHRDVAWQTWFKGTVKSLPTRGVRVVAEVKPPNLLVDRDMQQVKLADFGVSKILEASGFAGPCC